MPADFDAVIIGAGAIGLAIARALALQNKQVLVIEKAASAGTETSSRNSEVIHAGIYYPAGSLKARFCVAGRDLLYAYCRDHGVEHRRTGKLIVAASAEEEAKLIAIHALAKANGVADLQWLQAQDVKKLEPEIRCSKALLSPSTGIVDARGFMLSLQGVAEAKGTSFAFNTTYTAARQQDGLFITTAQSADGETVEISSHSLINAAGHGAHAAACAIAGFDPGLLPPQFLAKGNYCSVSGRSPFKHLIYPVPVAGALGIHATLDLGGATRFGPDIQWTDEFNYDLPQGLPAKFKSAIAPYWPEVMNRELSPTYCGLRPKTHGPDQAQSDFMIQTKADHSVANLVNLFGIESPGLTSSLAIAAHVAKNLGL